jgi:hypothetical protein
MVCWPLHLLYPFSIHGRKNGRNFHPDSADCEARTFALLLAAALCAPGSNPPTRTVLRAARCMLSRPALQRRARGSAAHLLLG